MKARTVYLLCSLSLFAADSNDVQVLTTTVTNIPNNYLETVDVFTRNGQTNLIRRTQSKNGVVLFRAQNFYHDGAELGQHLYNGAETIIGSTPGARYHLTFRFGTSNELRSAIVSNIRTNHLAPESVAIATLDSFGCTNGVFYPRDGSWIREVNSVPSTLPLR